MPETSSAGNRSAVAAMLRAHSLAVVGASERPDAFGSIVLRQLFDAGYRGAIFPVNPRYRSIHGLACFPSVASIGVPIDCAILAVGNERLEAALSDAVQAGSRSAVVFGTAHGVAADGESPLSMRVAAIARDAGMALCGANGMGFFNFCDRLLVTGFPYGLDIAAGGIGFISHSGSAFSAIVKNRRGLHFNYAISSGQELVTTATDYLRFLIDQPETRVVACFLETVRDPDGFVAALRIAHERDIPVVVLKVGKSEQGRALAQAHSGAIVGVDAAYQAVFDRYNVVRVASLDEMLDTLELFDAKRRPRTPDLALASDSGGERGLIVDVAADLGLPFVALSPETTETLRRTLDPELPPVNPLDLWASGEDFERVYEQSLRALAADPATGMTVLAVDLPPASRLLPSYVGIAERVHRATDKPFAVLGNAATTIDGSAAESLRRAGIPVLMGTINGLAAIRNVLRYQALRANVPGARVSAGQTSGDLATWRKRISPGSGEVIGEQESKALLAAYGIPVAEVRVVRSEVAAVRAASELGLPVVLKTAIPGVAHKSDRGGVFLDLRTMAAVRKAYRTLRASIGPIVAVEPMVDGTFAVELILGMTNDDQFGPICTVGLGGVFVELVRDVVSFVPPVDESEAERLVRRLRTFPLFAGVRGRPPIDLTAVTRAISAFSVLCAQLGDLFSELDVNPLIAGPNGAIAVDALAVPLTCPAPTSAGPSGTTSRSG